MKKTFQTILGIVVCLGLISCGRKREGSVRTGEQLVNSIGMKFRWIPPGSFMMGSDKGMPDEKPMHKVTLTNGFYMGVYEVTQEEWEKVMGSNPSYFKGPKKPVDSVNWGDAQEFARKLSEKDKVTYRLPTEAEWEYACRAGTTTEYYWGDDVGLLEIGEYAFYDGNSGRGAYPVGQKKPNAWGLYDMSGNVWEWCEDWYSLGYPADKEALERRGAASGSPRVMRGGSWHNDAHYCRSAARYGNSPSLHDYYVGFRLVRPAEENTARAREGAPRRQASAKAGDKLILTLPGAAQVKLTMRRIPAGTFIMGSPTDEYDRNNDEGPTHEVSISRPFYMGVYEVTQEQWQAVMNNNPSHFGGNSKHPVENVSWEDAQAFIKKLNTMGLGRFRLPTEAEWEYACRAGTSSRFFWGDDPDPGDIFDYAWYMANSRRTTHPVGQKKPNAWGLYDMSGNVWELCEDWWDSHYYSDERQADPTGAVRGNYRVMRGGSWRAFASICRSANRDRSTPSFPEDKVGFRLVRAIE